MSDIKGNDPGDELDPLSIESVPEARITGYTIMDHGRNIPIRASDELPEEGHAVMIFLRFYPGSKPEWMIGELWIEEGRHSWIVDHGEMYFSLSKKHWWMERPPDPE